MYPFYILFIFQGSLTSSVINDGYKIEMNITNIAIGGLNEVPRQVKLNGMDCKPYNVSHKFFQFVYTICL